MSLLILELLDAKFSRSFVSIRIIILLQVLLQEVAEAHDDQELTLGTNYTVFLFQLSRLCCSKLQHINPKPFQMLLLLILELLDANKSFKIICKYSHNYIASRCSCRKLRRLMMIKN
jgi:hypothetical protein